MAQDTDFQIPNGTGQAVRLDIQTAILALASLSSGSQSGLGTTQPCQLFADTANGLLKIRDTGGNAAAGSATFHTIGTLNTTNLGLLPRSGGSSAPMTGVLQLSTGSASAPSVNFGSATTGFFQNTANAVGFTGASNLAMQFSNDGFDMLGQRPVRFYESDSTHNIQIKAPSSVASDKVLTLPDETGTILTSASTIPASQTKAAFSFINFNSETNSIRGSHNVSTITDHGVGNFSVNFTSSASNNDYSVTMTGGISSNNNVTTFQISSSGPNLNSNSFDEANFATGSFRFVMGESQTSVPRDCKIVCATVHET
tara:strand:- start:627 stop:1565 length:939 start_codon:yes stop_codon:yes gene_type:complete